MDTTYPQNELSFENIMQMFKEVAQSFKDTDKKFQATDKKFQDTEKLLSEKFEATDKKFQEMRNETRNLNKLFKTEWGTLMEALIKPSVRRLFNEWGIPITRVMPNIEIKNKNNEDIAEFDLVLKNGDTIVIVEVKTKFDVRKVDYFLEKMDNIKKYFPEYADKKFVGAVAGIKYDQSSEKYAFRKGLFVLVNSGEDIVKISNSKNFKPAEF